ncbi:MAG: AzlC family ABC transporter permease [Erysipelotrichaceae bacterium]|nr:AzlC family ABC transporter permease [Erysipelotrichaceae bacterium]
MKGFKEGFKTGIPIGLGYFAVAFSLGIAAARAGLTPFQGFLTSFLVNASAGENAAFIAIRESVPYLQMILITVVSNIRYVLMSFALSQKIRPKTAILHRLLLGFYLTDEYFALAVSQEPFCDPFYSYGAISFAAPCWAIGTAFGIIMGNALPFKIVSALSVALYGMFLAIIIPPAKKQKQIAVLIVLSFLSSYLLSTFTPLSESTVTIILTIAVSSLGALLWPVKGETYEE